MMEKLQTWYSMVTSWWRTENNMECDILREEVLALKENEAVLMDRHRSVQKQLVETEKELFASHDVITEQQCIMQRNENAHADIVKRLQEENCDVKKKLTSLFEDHKRLQEECEKGKEIINHYEKLHESFRTWNDCQLNAEVEIRQQLQKYSEFIQLLQQEKQKYLQQYREVYHDYFTLKSDMERPKKGAGRLVSSFSHLNVRQPLLERSKQIAEQREFIRQTVQRLSEQTASLQSEAPMQRPQSNTGPVVDSSGKSNEKNL